MIDCRLCAACSEWRIMIRYLFLHMLAAAMVPAMFAQETPAGEKRTLTFHRPETKGAKYELSAKASVLRTTEFLP